MKAHDRTRHLLVVLIFFLLTGCDSCEKYSDGPEISWLSGSSLRYSYSGGVLSGFTANLKFAVTDGTSGEIKLTAEHNGDRKSCVSFVEPGEEYTARVSCLVSSDGAKGTIIVSCPSASDPFTVKSEYKVIIISISIN
jgi:hypothetical protein